MSLPAPLAEQSPAKRAALKRRLEALYGTFDRSYLATDPLSFVHRYEADDDREIVAFLAASLAFGNVRAIFASLEALLAALGPEPATFVERLEPGRAREVLGKLYHRWIRAEDLVDLFEVLRSVRERSGTIGGFFLEGYSPEHPDVGEALASFCGRARALSRTRAGKIALFFPSPKDGSACKRLNLFMRWVVRDGDGLDLGLWKGVSRSQLVLPLDTHLIRLARALGLTRRRTPDWKMALEATHSLALLDPTDPVKYDFALSRLGILDLCLHGRDPLDCRPCGVPRPKLAARRKGQAPVSRLARPRSWPRPVDRSG